MFSLLRFSRIHSCVRVNQASLSNQVRLSGISGSTNQTREDEKLFTKENIDSISEAELARIKVSYGLLKDHVDALRTGSPPPEFTKNPLIDPRSFNVQQLPEIPGEVLRALRLELPAERASSARPAYTHNMWNVDEGGNLSQVVPTEENWVAVDERTTDRRQFLKMQPYSAVGNRSALPLRSASSKQRTKRRCALSNEKGFVDIDFRSVAKLSTFMTEGGKIFSRRKSGLSAKAQRKLARSVKSARQMALIAPDPRPGPTWDDFRAAADAM